MSTRYNTGNPIESTDVRDMSDNAKNFDEFSNSSHDTFTDRFGVQRKTAGGAIRSVGIPIIGNFTTGCTVTDSSQGVQEVGGSVYRWKGVLPKLVPPSSTPHVTGGISPTGDWVDVGDASAYFRISSELSAPLGVKVVGNAGIHVNSVAGLLPLSLVVGDVINLACYHFIMDNSNHVRVIEASDNGSGVQLSNGLWANITPGTGEVDISWMGAKRQVDFDSLAIIHKALEIFKTVKFSGHYYISSSVQMRDGYSLRGENIDTSIMEITTATGAANEGIVCYDKPVVAGQNAACIFTNLECMTLLSNINQSNWNTDGSGMVHCGIYGSIGSGLAGGVAQSAIRDIKVIGCDFVTDIKDGYLNAIDNIRGEKCHHGVSITKGTSYSIGLLSVVQVKNFCFKFDNVLYSNIKNLVADFCNVSWFLLASNSDISIGSVGAEVLTSVANMYRLSNSKVTIGTTKYISIGTTGSPSDSFHYLDGGSVLSLPTDNDLNDGWGIKSYDVSQSDLVIGNILNIRRQVYENIYQYTAYDLNTILGFRGYGKLFQFMGGHMPGPGNWVIDFVSTSNDLGISGKGSYQVGTSLGTGEVKRRRFDGTAWTAWG